MDRIVELGRLFDYYGSLLTPRQQNVLQQTLYEDCSLAEVAEREGMSRQGVRDALLHGEHQLRQYEAHLHLMERADRQEKVMAALLERINALPLSRSDRQELEQSVAQIAAIWEEEDGI